MKAGSANLRLCKDPLPCRLPEYWERESAPGLQSSILNRPPSSLHPVGRFSSTSAALNSSFETRIVRWPAKVKRVAN